MAPQSKQTFPKILYVVLIVILVLGGYVWISMKEGDQMAPGPMDIQMEEDLNPVIIVEGEIEQDPMPEIQLDQTTPASFGNINTPNGEYPLVGS